MSTTVSSANLSDESPSQQLNTESTEFSATPRTHAVTIHVQLDDDNQLYYSLRENQQTLNQGLEGGRSDSPHPVGQFVPSWGDDSQYTIGLFESKTGWTLPDERERGCDQHLGLYDDIEQGTAGRADLPAKTKLVIEPRKQGMETSEGDEFRGHPGVDGEYYEGTYIRIQCSYIQTPTDALARGREILSAAFGSEILDYFQPIEETFRFANPEAYIRFDSSHLNAVVEELKSTARLLVTDNATGSESADIQKGTYQIYGVRSDNLEELGFRQGISSSRSEYLKVYHHQNHQAFPDSHPLSHPKLEHRVRGGFHVDKWDEVIQRCHRIVLAHAHWAGLAQRDFVEDSFFDASEPTVVSLPVNRKQKLREYYEREEFNRSLTGRLFHSRTKSDHDILTVLLHRAENYRLSYDKLAQLTGLAKRTVRKRVRGMVEDKILSRLRSSCTFVSFANDLARKAVRRQLTDSKTTGERFQEVRQRAKKRRERRNSEEESEETENNDSTTNESTSTESKNQSKEASPDEARNNSERRFRRVRKLLTKWRDKRE